MDKNSIGHKIYELRKKSGYSQEELGDLIGVSRQSVSKWELNETVPSSDKIKELSALFSVSADFLLENQDSEITNDTAINETDDIAANEPTILIEEVAATKPKKRSKLGIIICLSILGLVFIGISVVFGTILFTPNQTGLETVHAFNLGEGFVGLLLILVAIAVVLIFIILYFIFSKRKNI